MKRIQVWRLAGLIAAPVSTLLMGGVANAETPAETAARLSLAGKPVPTVKVGCSDPSHKYRCHAMAVADESGKIRRTPVATARTPAAAGRTPAAGGAGQFQGYTPTDLASAYKLDVAPANGGSGQTVAIIDAYHFPTALSDLNQYRTNFNLPAMTAGGPDAGAASGPTLTEYPASGSTFPGEDPNDSSANGGWGDETMLDLEMVSAACPACNIIIIEPSDAEDPAFNTAPALAVQLGAIAISNSFGSDEDGSITSDTSYQLGPNVLVTASAGDEGYGASYPATSPYVIAVGGTNLVTDTTATRGWDEYLWGVNTQFNEGATGSGCSQFIPQPSFQVGKMPSNLGCGTAAAPMRMESDISAVADPATGVQEWLTYNGSLAQAVTGGTSASSPFVAAMMVRFGLVSQGPAFPYQNTSAFFDVTTSTPVVSASETNTNDLTGKCKAPDIKCSAAEGYDGPTGWGSPNGTAWVTIASSGSSSGGEDAGSGDDSGSVGSLDGGGSDSGSSSGSSSSGGNGATGGTSTSAGCAVSTDASSNGSSGFLVALGAIGLLAARRRRN